MLIWGSGGAQGKFGSAMQYGLQRSEDIELPLKQAVEVFYELAKL